MSMAQAADGLRELLSQNDVIEPEMARDVTNYISSLLGAAISNGGMEADAGAKLQEAVVLLGAAAVMNGTELALTSEKLNLTVLQASSPDELANKSVRCAVGDDGAVATASIPKGLASVAEGFNASLPVRALLYTTAGTAMHAPLAIGGNFTNVSASSSPMVSFSLLQARGELVVKNTSQRINVSIPAVPTPDPDFQSECRWHADDGSWPTQGCDTILAADGSVNCSCNHLTDFVVFQVPRDPARYFEKLDATYVRAPMISACFATGPLDDPVGWAAIFFILFLNTILLLHALRRDIEHAPKKAKETKKAWYEVEETTTPATDTPEPAETVNTMMQSRWTRALHALHPLLAAVKWEGVRGYTRAQTAQIVVNTLALELLVCTRLVLTDAKQRDVDPGRVITHALSASLFILLLGLPAMFYVSFHPYPLKRFLVESLWICISPLVARYCPRKMSLIWPKIMKGELQTEGMGAWFKSATKGSLTLPPKPPRPITPEPWDEDDRFVAELALQHIIRVPGGFGSPRNFISTAPSNRIAPVVLPRSIPQAQTLAARDKVLRVKSSCATSTAQRASSDNLAEGGASPPPSPPSGFSMATAAKQATRGPVIMDAAPASPGDAREASAAQKAPRALGAFVAAAKREEAPEPTVAAARIPRGWAAAAASTRPPPQNVGALVNAVKQERIRATAIPALTPDEKHAVRDVKARKKANARRARHQLWSYRYKYAKIKAALYWRKISSHSLRAKKRLKFEARGFPNPFNPSKEQAEDIANQYLMRAYRQRDVRAGAQVVGGWLINGLLLLFLLLLIRRFACELSAYEAAGPSLVLWTWGLSALLRNLLLEPFLISSLLWGPWVLRTYFHHLNLPLAKYRVVEDDMMDTNGGRG